MWPQVHVCYALHCLKGAGYTHLRHSELVRDTIAKFTVDVCHDIEVERLNLYTAKALTTSNTREEETHSDFERYVLWGHRLSRWFFDV